MHRVLSCPFVFPGGFTTDVLMFRWWLLAQLRSRRHGRAARNVGDLSFFDILRYIMHHIGVRVVMTAVVGRAILGDQASALDPPVVFFKKRIRDCFPNTHTC